MSLGPLVFVSLALSLLSVLVAESFLRPIRQDFADAQDPAKKQLFIRNGRTKFMYSLLFFHGYPSYVAQSAMGQRALAPFRLFLSLSMLPFVVVTLAWLAREETRLWGLLAGAIEMVVVYVHWRFRWPDLDEGQP